MKNKTTINKKLLSAIIAEKLDISKKKSFEYLEILLKEIKCALENKKVIDLAGFGKFNVRPRAARNGFNPQTKEKIFIKASHSVGFKAAKALKELVKNPKKKSNCNSKKCCY